MSLPKHSTVAAYLALFASLGGTSYAAVELRKDSVGAREIKRSAVRSSEIKNGSVGVADLSAAARPERLTKARAAGIVQEVLTDPTLGLTIRVQGERGEKGDPGQSVPGPAGSRGPAGIADVVTRSTAGGLAEQYATSTSTATCQPGERVLGGGASFATENGGPAGAEQTASRPLDDASGWTATYSNAGPNAGRTIAYAVCAKVTG